MKFKKGEIRRALDRRGLTVREFARIAGVAPNTVMRSCRGESMTKITFLRVLAALSHVAPLEKVS